MSGVLQIPNAFAAAVTATGQQLDADFNTVTAYINDPTNRNNYGADTGTTNTVALSFSPPVVGGYTAGLELTWKWAATNAGASIVNANSLGAKNLVNPDGSNLQSGQGTAGSVGKAVYDGTQFIFISPPSPASKAAMQTATSSASFVIPAQVQNHPGVAKMEAVFQGTSTGTITALYSYNVTSIVRTGTGTYSIAFGVTMNSTAYVAVGGGIGLGYIDIPQANRLSTGCMILTYSTSQVAADGGSINFVIYGTAA